MIWILCLLIEENMKTNKQLIVSEINEKSK